MRVIKLIQ